MSGLCDRCNERTSHIVNISRLPEMAPVAHLGYRQVCAPCYDDLLAEATEAEERDEDRRAESRAKVSIKARVEGNTAHLEAFSEEMMIEEISLSGLRLRTAREIDPGAVLKVSVPSIDFEATAIVQTVWREAGERSIGLKLIEPSEGWQRLWEEHAPEE
ncbi:MAG TPA: PilZ domain-containing protein [Blastocatellia bacterium]|nr:PilZ domain-containing protein [Blastocatellia bacterium]